MEKISTEATEFAKHKLTPFGGSSPNGRSFLATNKESAAIPFPASIHTENIYDEETDIKPEEASLKNGLGLKHFPATKMRTHKKELRVRINFLQPTQCLQKEDEGASILNTQSSEEEELKQCSGLSALPNQLRLSSMKTPLKDTVPRYQSPGLGSTSSPEVYSPRQAVSPRRGGDVVQLFRKISGVKHENRSIGERKVRTCNLAVANFLLDSTQVEALAFVQGKGSYSLHPKS